MEIEIQNIIKIVEDAAGILSRAGDGISSRNLEESSL